MCPCDNLQCYKAIFTGFSKTLIRSVLTKTKRVDRMRSRSQIFTLAPLFVNVKVTLKIQLLVYKALNGSGPKYIYDLLLSSEPSRPLRASGQVCLLSPGSKLKHSFYLEQTPRKPEVHSDSVFF